jgi:hypothetical protein
VKELAFAFMQAHGGDERESLLLAHSIRRYGGAYADAPIWVLIPQGRSPFSEKAQAALRQLDVNLVPFDVPDAVLDFPFGGKVFAARAAESRLESSGRLLVWMDSDTVILKEPREFLIPENISLGYRPVMLKNISSPYDEPVDEFWRVIFKTCGTSEAHIFPMETTSDKVIIRPQFNAGILVVRPEKELLRSWAENFAELYGHPALDKTYQEHILYKIFVHQSVLSATLLAMLKQEEMQDLGPDVNLPVFLGPERGDAVTSLRYDEFKFFSGPDWESKFSLDEERMAWLREQIL